MPKESFPKKINKYLKIGGLATTILLSKEIKAQYNNSQKDYDQYKTEEGKDSISEKIKIEYLQYMKHPSYKERLKKEMFGDNYNEESDKDSLDNEYENRVKNIEITYIQKGFGFGGNYSKDNAFIVSDSGALPHELSHSEDNTTPGFGFVNVLNKTLPLTQSLEYLYKGETKDTLKKIEKSINILSNALLKYIDNADNFNIRFDDGSVINFTKNNAKDFLDTKNLFKNNYLKINPKNPIKALNYFIDFDTSQYQKVIKLLKEKEKIRKENQSNYDYLKQPTEVKARLNHLRFKAIKMGYDLNDSFDMNNFPELKKDFQYLDLKDGLKLNDRQINKLMEYVA